MRNLKSTAGRCMTVAIATVALAGVGPVALSAHGTETSTALSPDADGGGNAFNLSCGSDRVLIGITGAQGQWVDRVQGICIQVTSDGKWIGGETTTASSGGTSGTSYTIRCVANSAVVALSGWSGTWVDKLQVHCRPLGSDGFVTGSSVIAGEAGGSGGSTAYGPNACAGDTPARGLFGFSGQVIVASTVDRIGLKCATPAVFALTSVSLGFSTVLPNGARGDVKFTRAAPAPVTAILSSENPTVASVPASVHLSTGQSSATFSVNALNAGCTTIIASDGGTTRSARFIVQPAVPASASQFSMTTPDQLLFAGGSYSGSVRVDYSQGAVVTFTSSNPNVVKVPASMTLAKTLKSIPFTISAVGRGCATITGTYGPFTFQRVVTVEYLPG